MLALRPSFHSILGTGSVILACTASAHAAGADDASRAAARTAGYEGIRAYQGGDFNLAVDKLDRAFGVVKVPTLGLWYARALVKVGKLVEASERYREVVRLEVTEGKIKEQKKAQAEAVEELEALQAKIPALTITVQNVTENTEILLDGNPVAQKLLGLATPANPGAHRVSAKQDTQSVERTVTLSEGDKKSVELKLKPAAKGNERASSAIESDRPEHEQREPHMPPARPAPSGGTQKTFGWIGLGLGGVATIAGSVAGVLAMSKRKQLDDSQYCTGTVCEAEVDDQRLSYNRMRTLSAAGFIVGVVGVGVGTTLLLTTPKPKENQVGVWLGVASVGLKGNF
ncbi:MAG TPA: hypothetical protein VKP30_17890 [Polyangiaceae bacterium]|nr:hypothetical protein [Polyangiaceae bacterium]